MHFRIHHLFRLTPTSQTTTAIMAYLHAMYLFPGIEKKVYEEIANITGGSRLPTTADRPALRYTEAVWKEAFRWNSFVPLVRTTRFNHSISSIDHVPRAHLTSL